MRHWPRTLAAVGLLLLAAAFLILPYAHAAAVLLTKGPYLQNPGPTAITVQYETSAPGDGYVKFGAGGTLGEKIPAQLHEKVGGAESSGDKKSAMRVAYLYRARLTGLKPGTEYQYQVVPDGASGQGVSAARTFRTFPEKADRVTFIAYGDTRSNPTRHREVAANFNAHNPAFILHDGDFVSSGAQYDLWGPQFFAPLADVIDHVPMMVAIGNHEGDPKNLLRLFDMPGGRLYYSFDYGPVHVTVLDSERPSSEMLKWLDQDLAAAQAPWKIAMYHAPTFNFDGHKSAFGRTTVLPLLEKYGVDVVVAGHSHMYERFKPLLARGSAEPRPVTFITAGGGGAPLYDITSHSPLLAKSVKDYHFCVFTVDAQTLHLKTFTDEGHGLDELSITKTAGRYDPAYVAQAQPMEAAILAQGLILAGDPEITRLPDPRQPGEASFKVAFSGLTAPATVTVRLADASKDKYAMDPVTVQVGSKDDTVRWPLKALVKVAAERKEKREILDPEPRFIVTAKCGAAEQTLETAKVRYKGAEAPTKGKEATKKKAA